MSPSSDGDSVGSTARGIKQKTRGNTSGRGNDYCIPRPRKRVHFSDLIEVSRTQWHNGTSIGEPEAISSSSDLRNMLENAYHDTLRSFLSRSADASQPSNSIGSFRSAQIVHLGDIKYHLFDAVTKGDLVRPSHPPVEDCELKRIICDTVFRLNELRWVILHMEHTGRDRRRSKQGEARYEADKNQILNAVAHTKFQYFVIMQHAAKRTEADDNECQCNTT